MTPRIAPEFALVAACCRWPRSTARREAVRAAASAGTDWGVVAAIAQRHRVEGLLHDGLADAGVTIPAGLDLRDNALAVARQSLELAVETGRLQRMLAAQGLDSLILKGAAVEVLAYGALGLKQAWDIDLLVAPESAEEAIKHLRADGYELVQPADVSAVQLRTWISLTRECELRRPNGPTVELHWRLTDNPLLLPELSVRSPFQTVALADGLNIRTFRTEELFAYMCVHGALHGWSRLKWLADLAGLLGARSPDEIEALYRSALDLRAGLCVGQALALCDILLGVTLPAVVSEDLSRDARVGRLVRTALTAMGASGDTREIDRRPVMALRILASHVFLGGDLRHAAAELRHRAVSLHDRTYVPLPRQLQFLYPLLRAPLWIARRAGFAGRPLKRKDLHGAG